MDKFIVGSNAFFKKYKDFNPHDVDILILEDNPLDYKIQQQIRLKGNCYFKWKRMTPQEYIDYHKNCSGLFLGKFLIPEFCKEIGFSINDLKKLNHLKELLDAKHEYEKIIYDSYIENNGFYLTDAQLEKAYNIYKNNNI